MFPLPKKRSRSSNRWLERQRNDPYVQRAQAEGYRSRAAYKLLELQDKDQLLKPGQRVVDLGAAPGGWCQIAKPIVGHKGRVIGLDLLDFDPIEGVETLVGDFREDACLNALRDRLNGEPLDLVLSDMAPNVTGMRAVDQPRSMLLVEMALEFACETLKPGGSLVVKAFHGEGFDQLVKTMRQDFDRVVSRKPKASRPQSRETYLVAKGRRVG